MTSETSRAPGSFAIEKTVAIIAAVTVSLIVVAHGTAWLIATLSGHEAPPMDAGRVASLLHGEPYAPNVPVPEHLALISLALAGIGVAARAAWLHRSRRAASPRARAAEFTALRGWATPAAVREACSARALLRQAATLRPAVHRPRPADVGYLLGTSRGQDVWASIERSVLVLGPPGSGKGLHLAINAILDAPGPVITTSTKPDNLKATVTARAQLGPIGVFDPQGMLPSDFDHHVAWDLIAGCEDPVRAATRAEALAANTGISDGSDNRIWRGHAATVIQTVLHAAALQGLDVDTAYRWLQSEHTLEPALDILENHPDACLTWDARLRGIVRNPDYRFVGSVMSVVNAALAPLALPTVRAALTPSPARSAITAEAILDTGATIYTLATDRGAAASAGLAAALIEDIAHVARITATRAAGGRLDPPLLLLLDECANVAPIPSLPALLADGRGQNLTVVPLFQTLGQVRSRYGRDDAATIFSAAQIKIILGGTDDPDDCRDLSALIGERDDWYATTSRNAHALAIDTRATASTSLRRIPILPPDAIRAIPFGSAVVLQSQVDPFPLTLRAWTTRPDARTIAQHAAAIETQLIDRQHPGRSIPATSGGKS